MSLLATLHRRTGSASALAPTGVAVPPGATGATALSPRERRVLAVAIMASVVVFLDASIVNIANASISASLHGGLVLQQWDSDSYTLTLAAFILTAGALSDALGRVTIMKLGVAGFGLASLLCAAAPSAGVLVAARAAQGLAGALLVPSSLALIASTFRGPAQARAIGRWSAATSGSFVVGPLLGGVLVDSLGWRAVFAVNVIPVLITLRLLRRIAEPTVAVGRRRVDIAGSVLAVLGLGGLVFGLIQTGHASMSGGLSIAALAVGVLGLVGFVLREARAANPMLPLRLFRSRNFCFGNLASVLVWGALYLGVFIVPTFLQQVAGYSASAAGAATAPMTVIGVFVAASVGRLAARFGPKWFVATGPLLAAAGYAWLALSSRPISYWSDLLPAVVLVGLGISFTSTPVTAAVLSAVTGEQAGIASAVNNAVTRVAGLVTIAVVGLVTGSTLDYPGFHRVVLVVAALMVAGAAVAAVGLRNRPAGVAAPSA
jgi:EmrB/QacA subfamily drug resistance transporter